MEITKTRTYRFTAAELNAINTFCKIADSIYITSQLMSDGSVRNKKVINR